MRFWVQNHQKFRLRRVKKHLKALFLRWKSYFRSLKSQNFRACGATTLPTIIQNVDDVVQSNYYKIIVHKAATIQAIFKFTGGCRALYTCAKRFLHCGWRAEILLQSWFTGGYRALYTCTKRFSHCGWRTETWFCWIYKRLSRSLHVHKLTNCGYKKNCSWRKVRRRREKIKYKSETIVSGVKNIAKITTIQSKKQ